MILKKLLRFTCQRKTYLHTFPILDQILTGPRLKHTKFHDYSSFSLSGRTFSIEQIRAQSVNLALKLETESKIKPGDKVAAFVDNSIFTVIATCATWLAGGVFVPLSSKYPDEDVKYFLDDSDAKIFIHSQNHTERLESNFDIPVLELHTSKLPVLNPPQMFLDRILVAERNLDKNHPALIVYTSGTTGKPKGALHTHSSVFSAVNQLNQAWKWSEKDSILHCLPLHHVHGFVNALLCPLSSGADIHMLNGFKNPEQILNQFESGNINVFMAVPTIYTRLVNYLEENGKNLNLSEFRLLVSGSAALPKPIFEKFEKLSGGYKLLERYGMTEINMAISNPLEPENDRIPGFVGKELPGVKVRLVDENDNVLYETDEVIPDSNTSGKLYVKSPSIFTEYLNKPDATSETFTDCGWFKTGDMAEYDSEKSSFRILGRESTDIIKSGGYKISALQIEEKILEINSDKFSEIAVIGTDCEDLGEKIVLIVVTDEENCVIGLDFKNLVKYQRPHIIHVINDPLPRNVMGKVNKKLLKKNLKF